MELIKKEEIFNRELINEIEDYDEVIEEQNEKFFYGNIKMTERVLSEFCFLCSLDSFGLSCPIG